MNPHEPIAADRCRYDIAALGEVMLRFDPGDSRIVAADHFRVWEGGGEYNVAHALTRCFGMRGAVVTALVDNPVGRLIQRRMTAGGLDTRWIRWLPGDGIGESRRNGIYFMERGFGQRPALGVFDRGHSAIAQAVPGDFDWEALFGRSGVRWFHSGGIMAGLSPSSCDVVIDAMQAARRHGAVVSYDLNYRPSLWKRYGGKAGAKAVNRRVLACVDVLFGLETLDHYSPPQETGRFRDAMLQTVENYPQIKTIASGMRVVKSANVHDWSGLLWHAGEFYAGPRFDNLAVYDRVGSGDGFAAGVIYGLLSGGTPQAAIDTGVAHGALVMTTPGDTTMATRQEVENVLKNRGIDVIR